MIKERSRGENIWSMKLGIGKAWKEVRGAGTGGGKEREERKRNGRATRDRRKR